MRTQTRHMHGRIVQRIIDAVTHYQSGPLRIPELAHTAGLSKWHMARVFRAQTGEAPSEFLRRIRLERAAHRLIHTDFSVGLIGIEACYQNGPSFTRGFLQAFGKTPSAFRAGKSSSWHIQAPADIHWQPHPIITGYRPVELTPDGPVIEIIGSEEFTFGAYRVRGSYGQIHELWKQLFEAVLQKCVLPEGTRFITIYNDSPGKVAPDQLRIDLCIARPDGLIQPGFTARKMPAGSYVRTKDFLCERPAGRYWCPLTRHWVPQSGARPQNVPAYEESYVCPGLQEEFPMRMYVGLEIDLDNVPPLHQAAS